MIRLSALSSAGLTIRSDDPSGIVLHVDDSESTEADEARSLAERHGWASLTLTARYGYEIILTPPEALEPDA